MDRPDLDTFPEYCNFAQNLIQYSESIMSYVAVNLPYSYPDDIFGNKRKAMVQLADQCLKVWLRVMEYWDEAVKLSPDMEYYNFNSKSTYTYKSFR